MNNAFLPLETVLVVTVVACVEFGLPEIMKMGHLRHACYSKKKKEKESHKTYQILAVVKPAVNQGFEWDEFIIIL